MGFDRPKGEGADDASKTEQARIAEAQEMSALFGQTYRYIERTIRQRPKDQWELIPEDWQGDPEQAIAQSVNWILPVSSGTRESHMLIFGAANSKLPGSTATCLSA